MNYESKKAEIESKIKELQEQLETLEKTAKKEEWKKSLIEKFKEFIERTDFTKVEHVEFYAKRSGSNVPEACEGWFYNPEKVETQPEPEPTAEEKTEPENKFKIGDYVYYRNCNVYGDIVEIKGGIISIKEKDGNIYKVHPEWIYKTEKPAEKPENKVVVCSVPKPNETTEEKPVKMKMTLDEFIDSLPEPAEK